MLDRFPVQFLHYLIGFLEARDIFALRLTCKYLEEYVEEVGKIEDSSAHIELGPRPSRRAERCPFCALIFARLAAHYARFPHHAILPLSYAYGARIFHFRSLADKVETPIYFREISEICAGAEIVFQTSYGRVTFLSTRRSFELRGIPHINFGRGQFLFLIRNQAYLEFYRSNDRAGMILAPVRDYRVIRREVRDIEVPKDFLMRIGFAFRPPLSQRHFH